MGLRIARGARRDMRTLYSLTLVRDDGGVTIVDYLDELGWRRHEFELRGDYESVAPCTVAALEPLHSETVTALVHELRKAAGALCEEIAAIERRGAGAVAPAGPVSVGRGYAHAGRPKSSAELPSPRRVDRLRRDWRELLERLVPACSEGWSEAVALLARTPADDQEGVARARRALIFMRDSREHAARTLAREARCRASRARAGRVSCRCRAGPSSRAAGTRPRARTRARSTARAGRCSAPAPRPRRPRRPPRRGTRRRS